jgi:hypothetical protein
MHLNAEVLVSVSYETITRHIVLTNHLSGFRLRDPPINELITKKHTHTHTHVTLSGDIVGFEPIHTELVG